MIGKWQRFLCLLVTALLIVSMTACSKNESNENVTEGTTTKAESLQSETKTTISQTTKKEEPTSQIETGKESIEETTKETTKETEYIKEDVKPDEPMNPSDSLIVNSGFEEGLEGWTINLEGPGKGRIEVDTIKSKEGNKALKLSVEPGSGETLQLYQSNIPLNPLTDYEISFYYYIEGMVDSTNLKAVDIYWYDHNGKRLDRYDSEELYTRITLINGTNDWTNVSVREKSPQNAVKASVYIHLVKGDRGSGGDMWIDDFLFRQAIEPSSDLLETPDFINLGIASNSAEARSGAIVKGSDGNFYAVLPSLGFLVCYDFKNETSTQHFFENNRSGAPYKSFASQAGKFYTGANQYFYEFDPVENRFTTVIDMKDYGATLTGWGFCEDDNGLIYFSNYPNLYLYSFDPKTKKIEMHGILDDTQMYCETQAADSSGWIYSAIGTAEVNVVGVNVITGEKKYMFPRIPGTGSAAVYKTKDGKVAALMTVSGKYPEGSDTYFLGSWYVLDNGEIKEKAGSPRHSYNTSYPWSLHIPYDDAPSIGDMDYPAHTFTYWDSATKKRKTVYFDYVCDGAECSPITLGPDGIIYGTTNHPMNIFTVDPSTDTLTDHGIKSIGASVGNICCYAYQGDILVGAAYSGGYIYRIDTKKGIVNDPPNVSPRAEAKVEAIHRPRSALALSDQETCLFSGYGGYGMVGAGMVLYNVRTANTKVIENKNLLEYHGILGMAELPDGNVLCGSTVLAPGGGIPVYDTAALFEFNPKTYEVSNIVYPFKGVPEIAHLVWANDAAHGITSNSIYFVYDYKTQSVIHQQNLSEYGSVVRQGMVYKDGSIFLLLSNHIMKINPSDYTVTPLKRLPKAATAGIAVTDNAVYYCSGSQVYKADVK